MQLTHLTIADSRLTQLVMAPATIKLKKINNRLLQKDPDSGARLVCQIDVYTLAYPSRSDNNIIITRSTLRGVCNTRSSIIISFKT